MWKLIVLTTVLSVAWGAIPQNAERVKRQAEDLEELWEHVHQLRHGHLNIVVHGHGDHEEHHEEHHESHEHSEDSHERHNEHEGPDHHDERQEDTHIHIGVGPEGLDFYHGNPLPFADQIPVDFVHGVCHMEAGGSISGSVYMKQSFMGKSPVTVDFDLHGFEHAAGHTHTFNIHRYGNTNENCVHVGHVFTPPHRHGHGGHGVDEHHEEHEDHHEDHEDHHESHEDHEDIHHDEEHAEHEGHRTEGVIGDLHCDENGDLELTGQEFNSFTLMGFHSVYGRSLVISDASGGIMACCQIGKSSGAHFGDDLFDYTRHGREEHEHAGHGGRGHGHEH